MNEAGTPDPVPPHDPREAALLQREHAAIEQEQLLKMMEEEAKQAKQENEAQKRRLDEREKKLDERQKKLDEREKKLDERQRDAEQREAKVAARLREAEERDERRKLAEKEQRRKDAELSERERRAIEREAEAEAGFAAKNREALQALEKERAALRREIEAARGEIRDVRTRGLEEIDKEVARISAQRHEALEKELSERRRRVEGDHQAALERERASLEEDRRRAEAEVRSQREALQKEQVAFREEAEATATRLREREATLRAGEHRIQIERSVLESDRAHMTEQIEQRAQERVEELERRLRQAERTSTERLEECLRKEKLLDGYKELERRLGGQSPEEVIRKNAWLEAEIEGLRRALEERPTLEEAEQIDQLVAERDAWLGEREELVRERNQLKAERTRWQSSVAELEAQRQLREVHERQCQALAAQMERYREEVQRLRSLYEAPQDREKRIQSIETPWRKDPPKPESRKGQGEAEWLAEIDRLCRESGMTFPRRLLLAFHTALKVADWSPLAVLAGVSGTGKSELPRLYARFGGLSFLPLPVQPNWDSPQSLFGFFNSIDNRFDATELLRALVQSQRDPKQHEHGLADRLLLVLLDEMNLAHVEQYFSDLLSKLELRRGVDGVCLPLELGGGQKYDVPLGRNVLWVGTMNEDETTKSLSDKVIDRSNLLYFPRPRTLHRRIEVKLVDERAPLPMETWKKWIVQKSTFSEEQVGPYKGLIESINGCLDKVGRALGHRVWQSMEHYMANHPDVLEAQRNGEPEALKGALQRAFEDQLVQKAMPKLRGIETSGEARRSCLDPIHKLIQDYGLSLEEDFALAMRIGAGAFVWSSARYLEDA